MKTRAFSLIEILICIAIIAVVAALTMPVAALALKSAKVSSASNNLHQLHLATMLYQADYGESVTYGKPAEMGLPSITARKSIYGIFEKVEGGTSPCGRNYSMFGPNLPLLYTIIYRPYSEDGFAQYASTYQQNLLLFYDVNCDDPGSAIRNAFISHRGLGVLYSGQLVNHYKPGIMVSNDSWWSSPVR